MAKISKMPPPAKTVIHRPNTAADAFALAENCIIAPNNDTPIELIGAQAAEFYAVKVEGESIVERIPALAGGGLGIAYYAHVRENSNYNERMFIAMPDNKIYMYREGELSMVRDVAADGYDIRRMTAYQTKRYMYFAIDDPDMASALYRYDNRVDQTITSIVAGVVSGIDVFAPDHGLQTGQEVVILGSDTIVYNGTYTITWIDINHFNIDAVYSVPMEGRWRGDYILKKKMDGLESAKIVAGVDGRLAVNNCDPNGGVVQYSRLSIDGIYDDFLAGTLPIEGGLFSGSLIDVNSMAYYKNLTFVFEKQRITAHDAGDTIVDSGVILKDGDTNESAYTVEGYGTSSIYGTCVGKGQLFYVDASNGVFSYSASGAKDTAKIGGIELSKAIREDLLKNYSLLRAAIVYHPIKDVLMIAASSVVDGENNVVFYYNFKTKAWSVDRTKFIRQFVWNAEEEQMYGVSSILPALTKVFDESHSTYLKEPITISVQERYFDGGRRAQLKEYVESSVIVGVTPANVKMTYSLYIDSEDVSQSVSVVNFEDVISVARETGPMGPSGETVVGEGFSEIVASANYVQYYNDEFIDDHRRMSVKIEETSAAPFVIYPPEVVLELLPDEIDDDF